MKNPLQAILDKIPYTSSVLDALLMDEIRVILYEKTNKFVSDSGIMLILFELNRASYIEISFIDPIDAIGRIHFIKKVLHGK